MNRTFSSLLTTLALVALISTPVLAADSWLMPHHDAHLSNFNAGERAIGPSTVATLHRIWTAPKVVQAVATDKTVYALAGSGKSWRVDWIDASSGRIVRTIALASLGITGVPTTLAYAKGKVLVGTATTVLALDAAIGTHAPRPRATVRWRTLGGASQLTVAGGTVYTGKGCQNAGPVCSSLASYALDLGTGRIRWRHRGNLSGPPALIAGLLYQTWFGAHETRVYDPASGGLVATMPLDAAWVGTDKIAYAEVLATNHRSWLGEIGPNGRPIWRLNLGQVLSDTTPVLAYGTLFVASNRFHPGLIAVNAATGKIRWALDLGPKLSLIAANHLLYVLHEDSGQLDILNAATGRTVRQMTVPGYAHAASQPNLLLAGRALYIVSSNGLIALSL